MKKKGNNNRIICDEILLYINLYNFFKAIFTFSLFFDFVRWLRCKVRFLLFDLFDDFEMSIGIKTHIIVTEKNKK